MPVKMLTCTCGNTELEKIGVRLHVGQNGNGKSLPLVALMCRGSGCGRVTFRPDENAKDLIEEPHPIPAPAPVPAPDPLPQNGAATRILALFERVYTERLVYKAIAERDAACQQLFDALKTNSEIRGSIVETFSRAQERLAAGEDLAAVLETLPSIR